ncbi:MAG: hypothetical protein IJ594_07440 [Oscillospiraceae bacterium]|nr:hypothetical protein [Oscillospiraceae bacterium]
MVALIIIGVLLLLIILLLLIPVGVDVGYEGGQFHLSAKANGFLLQLIPKPPKSEKAEKKPKKPKKEKKKKKPKEEDESKPKKKRKLDFSFDEIMDLLRAVLKGFGKFGRKLKVSRFVLHFLAAGRDPYNVAMLFAHVNAALSSLKPLCAQRFTVKDCDVWTDVDFTREQIELDLGVTVTIRIGQILGVGLTIGFGALKTLLRNKIRLRKERKQMIRDGLIDKDGNDLTKQTDNETIQEEERMAANG